MNYVIIFAKDANGQEVKTRFLLSLTKTFEAVKVPMAKALMDTPGVDAYEPMGRYTAAVSIAPAFDADEVLAALRPKIEAALSDIVVPKLIV